MKNHLSKEKSPYLKQHATNPVWWYSWGPDAFEKAAHDNKLILLSIGYSTCHWCHVMEHESFTDDTVAEVLNQNFVCIKLDREERPDIDSIYMNILVGLNGHGGWPLNMILTPQREAFFGGTYFPKNQFIEVMNEIQRVWIMSPEKIIESGKKITEWLQNKDRGLSVGALTPAIPNDFYKDFLKSFDFEFGGRVGAPKFIPSYGLRLLMRYGLTHPDSKAIEMVKTTLDAISRGGIYDHLGGGFHRYATDSAWLVPHFEKMLYDQAAMAHLFLEAFQITNELEYKLVLEEILEYVVRDLKSPEGGFYSAEDADSEGIEGTFYVWSAEEIRKNLNATEYQEFCSAYAVTPEGNFENNNILELNKGSLRKNLNSHVQSAQDKLFAKRLERPRPLRDEKILVSWNGLMISALAKAGAILREPKYTLAAKQAADYILNELRAPSGELFHQAIESEPSQDAVLDDYAFFIDALIELYQADFDESYITEAVNLQNIQDRLFSDPTEAGYFTSSGRDRFLIKREKSFMDNVTPSGNSMSVFNLLRLSGFYFDSNLSAKAVRLLEKFPAELKTYPSEFVQALMAYDYALSRPKQIAILGDKLAVDTQKLLNLVRNKFKPNQILACGKSDGSKLPLLKDRAPLNGAATAFVCIDHHCQLPTSDLSQLQKLIEN